mmetsp:Transcript_10546/g.29069  ORF Transcript_10546/g.29069 Transcript_10546/m.29069 type:complete len:260 (-) Transcript_10546:109-888(-)
MFQNLIAIGIVRSSGCDVRGFQLCLLTMHRGFIDHGHRLLVAAIPHVLLLLRCCIRRLHLICLRGDVGTRHVIIEQGCFHVLDVRQTRAVGDIECEHDQIALAHGQDLCEILLALCLFLRLRFWYFREDEMDHEFLHRDFLTQIAGSLGLSHHGAERRAGFWIPRFGGEERFLGAAQCVQYGRFPAAWRTKHQHTHFSARQQMIYDLLSRRRDDRFHARSLPLDMLRGVHVAKAVQLGTCLLRRYGGTHVPHGHPLQDR